MMSQVGALIFKQYQHIWVQLTQSSRSIGTYLKSHHLRKRFVHIAERTPMPIADINYLMGDAKKGVHCAEAYSYTLQDELANGRMEERILIRTAEDGSADATTTTSTLDLCCYQQGIQFPCKRSFPITIEYP